MILTYKCYEMYAHREKIVQLSCFEFDQEMDAILLIIDIVTKDFHRTSLTCMVFLGKRRESSENTTFMVNTTH
jgi:hypothetical protein